MRGKDPSPAANPSPSLPQIRHRRRLGAKVYVALLLELGQPYDTALGNMNRTLGKLIHRNFKTLHRVAAGAELQTIQLKRLQPRLEFFVDLLLGEIGERGSVDHDVNVQIPGAANAFHMILDISQIEHGVLPVA